MARTCWSNGLALWGVRHVFGMPGSHSTTIYDAIVRAGSIRTSLIRNEQSAAFAADGYARVTGQPGVVCTTAGPGATNALTGVAEVLGRLGSGFSCSPARSTPTLWIENAATITRSTCETIFQPVTGWCGTVRRVEEIPALLARAFQAMTWGRPRPAALFLPQDLMRAPCPVSTRLSAFAPRPQPEVPGRGDRAGRGVAGRRRASDHPRRRRCSVVGGGRRDRGPGAGTRVRP